MSQFENYLLQIILFQSILLLQIQMQRQRWRAKLPDKFIEVIKVAKVITLFLVQQLGPMSFVFKDPLDNIHKITIGKVISCTCLPGNMDHCIHSFYVFLKIFKVSQQNPILWQQSYTQDQIQGIVNGRYSTSISKRVTRIPYDRKQYKQENLEKQIIKYKKEQEVQNSIRLQIEQQSVCPICQQILLNQTALTFCKKSCGNNYHISCLKVWVQHKISSETQISCPMCRYHWNKQILNEIILQERLYIKSNQSYLTNCSCCHNQILYKIYKCIFCKGQELCQKCYFGWKHAQHDKFLMKKNIKSEWQEAQNRNAYNFDKFKKCLNALTNIKKNNQNTQEEITNIVEIFTNKKIDNATEKKNKLIDYLITCFPSVENQIYKIYKKIDFEQKDVKCLMCKKSQIIDMRRFYCKHFIDEKCLKFILSKNITQCPIDKCVLLHGYKQIKVAQKEKLQKQKLEQQNKIEQKQKKEQQKIEKLVQNVQIKQDISIKKQQKKSVQKQINSPIKKIEIQKRLRIQSLNKNPKTNQIYLDTRIRKK